METSAFEKMRAGIPSLLKGIAQRGMDLYGGAVSAEFDTGGRVIAPDHRPKQTRLAGNSNRLVQSFLNNAVSKSGSSEPGDRVREEKFTDTTVKVRYGSNVPYANIHDKGGAVIPNEKMARFFLRMWLQAGGKSKDGQILGDPFWFAMFIHAKRNHPFIFHAVGYSDRAQQTVDEGWHETMEALANDWIKERGL